MEYGVNGKERPWLVTVAEMTGCPLEGNDPAPLKLIPEPPPAAGGWNYAGLSGRVWRWWRRANPPQPEYEQALADGLETMAREIRRMA